MKLLSGLKASCPGSECYVNTVGSLPHVGGGDGGEGLLVPSVHTQICFENDLKLYWTNPFINLLDEFTIDDVLSST